MSKIVVCPNCGQMNIIKFNSKEAKCGKCWLPLKEKKSEKTKFSLYSWIYLLIIIGNVVFFLYPYLSSSNNSYPKVAMPYSGEEQKFVSDKSVAPLTIQTSMGTNYLVKIVDYYSKSNIMTIFIKGGDTIRTKVPLGTFEIRYASGNYWYGYKHLFGKDTSYKKANQSFNFSNTGYKITGYTLTLHRVLNGNLRTSDINPSEF